ncbi:hypothetical protein ODJ79_00305 [Actinoplanes sp. KI2]|uniref:hypothetical protein n=1 Tax=Actinoplanes sp. KI2 TaxID=2983315 RepID=UPI0021D5AC14|nr:hypothetical protein [Actinoplanes sp. KI2]MCU7722150.1 hypothetical protein [Actinoplanes sp. KI2]
MPPEYRPIDLDIPPVSVPSSAPGDVVEFGGDPPASNRRRQASGALRSLATDRRVVPLTALLAAVAALASLISEWQVTTVDAEVLGDGVGSHPVTTGVVDLGALGAAYLFGLFPLVVSVVLTMFGPVAGRRWARLGGLSVGGTLLAVLFATTASLGSESRVVPNLARLQVDKDQVQLAYGRGLWCATAGVVLAMLALYLADRHQPRSSSPPRGAGDPAPPVDESAWGWRRPPAARDEPAPDQPLELTVAPAKPFTSLGDDRDKPSSDRD